MTKSWLRVLLALAISFVLLECKQAAPLRPQFASQRVAAYWPLMDGVGATALDSSGANHPGTLVGFTSTAPDHGILSGTSGWSSDGRLDFDGGSDEVQTAFPLAELVDSSFTLEAVLTHNDANPIWTPIFASAPTP